MRSALYIFYHKNQHILFIRAEFIELQVKASVKNHGTLKTNHKFIFGLHIYITSPPYNAFCHNELNLSNSSFTSIIYKDERGQNQAAALPAACDVQCDSLRHHVITH